MCCDSIYAVAHPRYVDPVESARPAAALHMTCGEASTRTRTPIRHQRAQLQQSAGSHLRRPRLQLRPPPAQSTLIDEKILKTNQ